MRSGYRTFATALCAVLIVHAQSKAKAQELPICEDRKICPTDDATGQFAYLSDCSKYIDCWKGEPTLKDCGTGTVFNPRLAVCDYPEHVECGKCVSGDIDVRFGIR